MGGFLLAFLIKGSYGGSMEYWDGTEKTILGINIGIFGFGIAFVLILLSFAMDRFIKKPKNQ